MDSFPLKVDAVVLINKEIKEGRLIKPSDCSVCSSTTRVIHGHHDDYSKPLSVRWLCPVCHKRWHMINGPGINGGDDKTAQTARLKKGRFDRLKKKHCVADESKTGDMSISRSIVLLLEMNNWSQKKLEEEMKTHPGVISTVINRNKCNTDILLKIAKAFKMPASKFLEVGEQ